MDRPELRTSQRNRREKQLREADFAVLNVPFIPG
jgi:hypothetical protein